MLDFAYWDSTENAPERQAELIAVWVRSCLAKGVKPRLLTIRDATRSKRYKLALKRGKAGEFPIQHWALLAKRGKSLTNLEIYRTDLP